MNREYHCSFSFVSNSNELVFEELINDIKNDFHNTEQFSVSDSEYISDTEAYLYIDKDDGTRVQLKFDPVSPDATGQFVYVDIIDKNDAEIDGELVEDIFSHLVQFLEDVIDDVQLMD